MNGQTFSQNSYMQGKSNHISKLHYPSFSWPSCPWVVLILKLLRRSLTLHSHYYHSCVSYFQNYYPTFWSWLYLPVSDVIPHSGLYLPSCQWTGNPVVWVVGTWILHFSFSPVWPQGHRSLDPSSGQGRLVWEKCELYCSSLETSLLKDEGEVLILANSKNITVQRKVRTVLLITKKCHNTYCLDITQKQMDR